MHRRDIEIANKLVEVKKGQDIQISLERVGEKILVNKYIKLQVSYTYTV